MSDPISAFEYIMLGQSLHLLRNPFTTTPQVYADEISYFLTQLRICGLPNSRGIARALENLSIPSDMRTGLVGDTACAQFQLTMKAIQEAIAGESHGRQTIALETDGISKKLTSLPLEITLSPVQKNLHYETARSIETGAYRSAMVMGWNLAYDYIRQWVFDKHHSPFNTALAKRIDRKTNQPKYDPIKVYEDFFKKDAPAERVVLDDAFAAQCFGGEIHDHLVQSLRRRNNYAHPSFGHPSREQTNAYVDDLVDILMRPPFN